MPRGRCCGGGSSVKPAGNGGIADVPGGVVFVIRGHPASIEIQSNTTEPDSTAAPPMIVMKRPRVVAVSSNMSKPRQIASRLKGPSKIQITAFRVLGSSGSIGSTRAVENHCVASRTSSGGHEPSLAKAINAARIAQ